MDLIDRQAAMLKVAKVDPMKFKSLNDFHDACVDCLKDLPSAEHEMIREIRKWINSGNRGSADYFIVDKIEEIINKYE